MFYWEMKKEGWNIDLKFHKTWVSEKNDMTNPVKSLGYIKCCNSSNFRSVEDSSNPIKYNC